MNKYDKSMEDLEKDIKDVLNDNATRLTIIKLKPILNGPILPYLKLSKAQWQKAGYIVNHKVSMFKREIPDIEREMEIDKANFNKRYSKINPMFKKDLKAGKDYGKYRSPLKEDVDEGKLDSILMHLYPKTWFKMSKEEKIKIYNELDKKKIMKECSCNLGMNSYEGLSDGKPLQSTGSLPETPVEKKKKEKKKMKLSERILGRIVKEEENQLGQNAPDAARKPEEAPATDKGIKEPAEPANQSVDQDVHKEFMTALGPTMEKVKNNQIVTWEELKKLHELYEKIKK